MPQGTERRAHFLPLIWRAGRGRSFPILQLGVTSFAREEGAGRLTTTTTITSTSAGAVPIPVLVPVPILERGVHHIGLHCTRARGGGGRCGYRSRGGPRGGLPRPGPGRHTDSKLLILGGLRVHAHIATLTSATASHTHDALALAPKARSLCEDKHASIFPVAQQGSTARPLLRVARGASVPFPYHHQPHKLIPDEDVRRQLSHRLAGQFMGVTVVLVCHTVHQTPWELALGSVLLPVHNLGATRDFPDNGGVHGVEATL